MLLNIVKYLVKMTTVQVKMQIQAHVHAHTGEQLSWKISLFTHFSHMFAPRKPKYLLGQIFLVSFFLFLVSVVNSCAMQKVCRIRNAPMCHCPAQGAEGQGLEEMHDWGLDLNEVSELEERHV